jgi:hypothetical protein
MTKGLILGTSLEEKAVYEKIKQAKFIYDSSKILSPYHRFIPQLRLQVHNPSYFLEYAKFIKTEIEFDDISNNFPNNPKIIEALKRLYSEIPDLVYLPEGSITKMFAGEKVIPEKLSTFLSKF